MTETIINTCFNNIELELINSGITNEHTINHHIIMYTMMYDKCYAKAHNISPYSHIENYSTNDLQCFKDMLNRYCTQDWLMQFILVSQKLFDIRPIKTLDELYDLYFENDESLHSIFLQSIVGG